MKYFITLLFLSVLLSAQELPFPKLSGPYAVGQRQWTFRDLSRQEILAAKIKPDWNMPDAWRNVPVILYYPIEKNSSNGQHRATYAPLPVVKALKLPESFAAFHKKTLLHRKMPDNLKLCPVIIFSPGLGISSIFYTALLEEIVSHGYIVVAISHPYMSGNVYLVENDCVIPMLAFPTERKKTLDMLEKMIGENMKDFDFLLPLLERMNKSRGMFHKKMDLNRIILMGHSGGGMTATNYIFRNNAQCIAYINLDGGNLQGDGVEATGAWPKNRTVPFLKLHSASFPGLDNIPASSFGENQYLINIKRIDHKTFSDIAFFPGAVPLSVENVLPAQISHQIITKHILAFLKAVSNSQKIEWPNLPKKLGDYFEIKGRQSR